VLEVNSNDSAIYGTKNKANATLGNFFLLMLNKELHHFVMLNKKFSQEEGGLGVVDLGKHNEALLLKNWANSLITRKFHGSL
jgi:hypothetical protein